MEGPSPPTSDISLSSSSGDSPWFDASLYSVVSPLVSLGLPGKVKSGISPGVVCCGGVFGGGTGVVGEEAGGSSSWILSLSDASCSYSSVDVEELEEELEDKLEVEEEEEETAGCVFVFLVPLGGFSDWTSRLLTTCFLDARYTLHSFILSPKPQIFPSSALGDSFVPSFLASPGMKT